VSERGVSREMATRTVVSGSKLDMSLKDIIGQTGSTKRSRSNWEPRGVGYCEVNIAFSKSEDVGRIIGSGGATIKGICVGSGTFITFSKDNQFGTVKGSKESIIKGLGLIAAELAKAEGAAQGISMELVVPQTEVGKIVGRKGATVKRLEEESGAKVSIQSAIGGQQRIHLSGSPEAIHAVAEYIITCVDFTGYTDYKMNSLAHFNSHHPNEGPFKRPRPTNSSMLECTIALGEAEQVRKIIGHGGTIVKKISKSTSTFITFAKDNKVGTVKGKKENIVQAIQMMISTLEDAATKTVSISVFIPKDEIPKIIGKKGSTIKRFEEETGARISVSSGIIQPVKITGSSEAVTAAVELIFKCVDYFSIKNGIPRRELPNFQSSSYGFHSSKSFFHFKPEDSIMENIETKVKCLVSGEAVGAIIGHGGSGIKHIARSSGVTISFSRDMIYQEGCEVGIVVGKVSSVVRAFELITSKIDTLNNVSTGITMIVPSANVGWIIGKGGARIKQITQLTKANISINKEKVSISGTEENLISVEGSVTSVQTAVGSLVRSLSQVPNAMTSS